MPDRFNIFQTTSLFIPVIHHSFLFPHQTSEYIIQAYKYGAFEKIPEFIAIEASWSRPKADYFGNGGAVW